LSRSIWVLLVGLLMVVPAVAADHELALREFHPWGRFHVGSWSKVRVVTETLDEAGDVTGSTVTELQTLLSELALDHYVIKVDSTLEVAGKRFARPRQSLRLGYAGERVGERVLARASERANLQIAGRNIAATAQEVEVRGAGQKMVATVRFAKRVAPFVLERVATQVDLSNPENRTESKMSVVALEMPHEIGGAIHRTAHTRQVERTPQGETVTYSVISPEVPGELVYQTAQKLDPTGRVTHRSTLELVGYYVAPGPAPMIEILAEPFGDRRAARRYHKRARQGHR
jgi:hypothetical protein